MPKFITIEKQRAAVVLAEELNYSAAAQRLCTDPVALRAQIHDLTLNLKCSLFREGENGIEITDEGQVLIDGFRSFLAQNGELPD